MEDENENGSRSELAFSPPTDENFPLEMPLVVRPSPCIRGVRNLFRSAFRLVRTHAASSSPTNYMALPPVPHPPNVHQHSASSLTQGEDVVHELSTFEVLINNA